MLATALSLVFLMSAPYKTAASALRPDSVALEMTGSYPFRNGISLVMDSARSLAFVGSGAGVFIVDVSDPQNPEVLSDRIRCLGLVKDLWLDGNRLFTIIFFYTGTYKPERDVEMWDVLDPSNPVLLGAVDLPVQGTGVWARDSLLLASSFHMLYSYSIADPAHPALLDSAPVIVSADQIRVRDTLAFFAVTGSGIEVYSIADPSDLRFLARWGLESRGEFPGIFLVGDTLYETCGYGPVGRTSGLWIYDISDPLNGELLGAFDTIETYAYRCAVRDTFALVTYRTRGYALKILSVADPANVYTIDSLRDGTGATGIAWYGSLGYVVCTDRFIVYDLADPSSPVELSSVPISHVGYGIARSGDLLASTGQQFSVLDASGLGDPELVGLLDLDCYAVDLAADDSLGLIVGWTRESGYFLRAVDFHDPVNPVLLGTDSLPSNEVGILVRDSVGYVATETGLYIRDLLHPGLPVIGAAATSMRPRRLALRDSLCFVSGDRLRVFSMADLDSIRLVGDTAVEAVDLAIEDTILVAVRHSGGAILSISDPAHPRWLASLSAQNSRAVALADTLLIVGCVDRIDVWSVADPSQPRRLGVSWVEENVSDIDFHEDMVYTNLVRCYRLDIIPQGIQEPGFEPAGQPSVTPLVASHELYLRGPGKASLTDISGRKVMDLAPGQNDIRHIAPGVYFVRPAESGERPAVRKVVIQH